MNSGRLIVLFLMGTVLTAGLSGCIIISASPDPGTVIEMKPGDKVLFKVVGPVNTRRTYCNWTLIRCGVEGEIRKHLVQGTNQVEFSVNPSGEAVNKIRIECDYLMEDINPTPGGSRSLIDRREWTIRILTGAPTTIWQGDYCIEDSTDMQFLNGYTNVTGTLHINDSTIKNLEGLENLTSVGGNLVIDRNPALTNLTGLENLTSVGGNLVIDRNPALTNLTGLENLTSVGGNLVIDRNPALTSLTGLKNRKLVRDLRIEYCDALTSLSGLENLTSVGGSLIIDNNSALLSLSGLENLTYGSALCIFNNPALTSMSGLENIRSVGQLNIYENDALTSLTGLKNLIYGGILNIYRNPALTSLTGLENMTSCYRLDIRENDVLTSLVMTDLQEVSEDFTISDNPLLCRSLAEELMNQVLAGGGIGGEKNIEGNKECTAP